MAYSPIYGRNGYKYKGRGTSSIIVRLKSRDMGEVKECYMVKVPNEIMCLILEYLGRRDKINLRSTCVELHHRLVLPLNLRINLAKDFSPFISYSRYISMKGLAFQVQSLDFTLPVSDVKEYGTLAPFPSDILLRYPSVISLNYQAGISLWNGGYTENLLRSLPPSLTSLGLDANYPIKIRTSDVSTIGSPSVAKNWISLQNLKYLTSLKLKSINSLGVDILRMVARSPLTSLEITDQICDWDIPLKMLRIGPITTIMSLTSLKLEGYRLIGGNGTKAVKNMVLQTLSALTNLKNLEICNCRGICGIEVWNTSFISLERLYFSVLDEIDYNKWWDQFARLTNLRSLEIVCGDAAHEEGINNGIRVLRSLTNLDTLTLPYNKVTKRELREMLFQDGLPLLKELKCGDGQTCRSIEYIRNHLSRIQYGNSQYVHLKLESILEYEMRSMSRPGDTTPL